MTNAGSDMFATALQELGAVLARVDEAGIDTACQMLARAQKIVVYGCGREALQLKGLAMRLYHLGLEVSVVGDMNTPPLGPGDVFWPVRSGRDHDRAHLDGSPAGRREAAAHRRGCRRCDRACRLHLAIPAQTMARPGPQRTSLLPMGSVFEGALFLLFEVMVLKLKGLTGQSSEAMRARHTNME